MSTKGRHRRPGKAAGIVTGTAGAGLAGAAIITAAPAAHAAVTPAPASSVTRAPVRAVADTIRAAQPLTVTVQPGDTLSKIAQEHCGNPAMWTGIYEANKPKIRDYNLIYKDQVFILACKTASVPVEAAVTSAVTTHHQQAAAPAASVPVHESNVSTSGMGSFQSCVITRESGGRAQVMNSSGHYGLYQFDYGTWVSGGGARADFGHASVAEQNRVFANVYAARGTNPWAPYDGC